MKWYKHDTSANMDAKLQEILLDYGLEGYGLYWYCLELIAANVTPENLTFELEHDARIIARNTGCTVQRVEEMMTKFINLGLFESDNGNLTCLKLAKRADDYTAKLVKQKLTQVIDNKEVRESPSFSEKDPLEENRIDKKRKDKNRIEQKKKDSSSTDDIFSFWKSTFNKNESTKLTSGRKSKINARLKNYSVDEIKQAITNCSKNSFNVENGHTDLTLICRSDEKLEMYRDMKSQTDPLSQTVEQFVSATEERAERLAKQMEEMQFGKPSKPTIGKLT